MGESAELISMATIQLLTERYSIFALDNFLDI
jgi:hypothetical protein